MHNERLWHFVKKLIRFTNIKLTNLAEIVGYDTSYISKWCNKGKLPAAKAAPNVNKCLADVFAREIIIQEEATLSLRNSMLPDHMMNHRSHRPSFSF